jgi:2-hydroxy-6-oxonona-2,4-dienedioate hydrolase
MTTRDGRPTGGAPLPRYLRGLRRFAVERCDVDGRSVRFRSAGPVAVADPVAVAVPVAVADPVATGGPAAGPTPPPEPVPAVLVTGLALSGRYLLPLGAELARHRRVLVPEPPGFGGTPGPRDALDVPALADHLAAWMAAAALPPVVLVGNSMGCQVAAEVAARHPLLVSHLVLQGPTMDAAARSAPRQLARLALTGLREPPSLAVLQAVDWLGTGPRRIRQSLRHALAHRIEACLPAVRCPALVVGGDRDPIAPLCWAEQVAAALPDGAVQVLPGAVHAQPYSAPVRLAAAIERFLADVDRPGLPAG